MRSNVAIVAIILLATGSSRGDECFRCADGSCLEPEWVCDGEVQCPLPDKSDEQRGCQMFPETGCKSWYGKRHVRCPGSHECVPDTEECPVTPSQSIKDGEGGGGDKGGGDDGARVNVWCDNDDSGRRRFRCRSGMCVAAEMACDRKRQCDDGSDEDDGCRIFDDDVEREEERCISWYGKRHVQCRNSTIPICTLPDFSKNEETCRMCDSEDEWRCNDGFCISYEKVQNGIKNCPDGSDELHETWTYWNMIVVTIFVTLTGVLLSFVYRLIKRRRTFFDCGFCHSKRAARLQQELMEMTILDGSVSGASVLDSAGSSRLPMELIDIFELNRNWRESKMSLIPAKANEAKQLYARVHCDPVAYKNLYRYLFFRFATPRKLSGVTLQLLRWEEEFHCNDRVEALACWRLHMGSSDVLKAIVQSVREPGIVGKFYDLWMPFKDAARKKIRSFLRKYAPENSQSSFKALYNTWNGVVYLVKPFLGAACLYFDIFKDIVFAHLIFVSIRALTHEGVRPAEYPFEFTIMVALGTMFVVNLIIFIVISVSYSQEVFEMCQHSSSRTKIASFKVLSLLFAILMPAFLLANYVFYLQKGYSLQRELQTEDDGGTYSYRTKQFQAIERTRYRAKIHRRLYSLFRVTTAVVQSFTMIVILVVIVVVSGRPGREVKLVRGVTEKIVDFFQMGASEYDQQGGLSVLQDLDLVWSMAIIGSICYSLLMILSALVRYMFQCKDQNLLMSGKIFLSFYFTFHIVSRLTAFIAIFSTSEPTPLPDGSVMEPSITIFPASVLCLLAFLSHFVLIAWYKHRHVKNFSKADRVQRFIHVLVNTMVAIPYSNWDVDVPSSSDEDPMCVRTLSMPARLPTNVAVAKTSELGVQANGGARRQSDTNLPMLQRQPSLNPNQPCVTFPNVSDALLAGVISLRAKIIALWWKDPTRDITLQDVKEGCGETVKLLDEEAVSSILNDLSGSGFVNKHGLFLPQRTKREYFWMFVFQLIFSGLSIIIETVNGGAYTRSGSGWYVSWDIRLASFFIGLVFLALYYRRYHALRDLTSPGRFCNLREYVPVVCCCRDPEPLVAEPEEAVLREILCKPLPARGEGDGADYNGSGGNPTPSHAVTSPTSVTVETQTSIIERPGNKK